ncbi:glycosyltransferase family 2 protein [Salipiger marinus]|uniref:glycosyltransferase family 2 protein n=1 Tax=Salipiger marinus TaxID=555512 RepID=UPI002C613F55|nr:glycosyltransferase family 2 protein [Salipiger manganoxidans]MEB3421125.1 glycosyltransferase family 2 protein [Salipiger manganoxidans]
MCLVSQSKFGCYLLSKRLLTLKISVVTAVFNRERTIAEAIESVAAQTYPDVEHVIQDGESKDGTLAVIARVAGPEVSLQSARDTGIYDGINKGISRTTGDVVGLMHSDDLFASPHVLARVAEAMADPAVDGVYGDLDYVAEQDTSRIIRKWRSGSYDPAKLRRGWMPPHPTLYMRREIFDRWGLYDTSFRIAADYDAMLRYLSKGEIRLAYVPEVFVKMRVGGESNKSVFRILQKSREDYRALKGNGVGGLGALAMKNLSKIKQFF